jgi:hypothetical protein
MERAKSLLANSSRLHVSEAIPTNGLLSRYFSLETLGCPGTAPVSRMSCRHRLLMGFKNTTDRIERVRNSKSEEYREWRLIFIRELGNPPEIHRILNAK